ncbi:MAG: hypothetical protein ACXAC7_22900 [Candidatus Hodarchaeales archaeon]|jgi:hypothetical protein
MEEHLDSNQDYQNLIISSKNLSFSYCKDLIENTVSGLPLEGLNSNVEILFLIDDLVEQIQEIIRDNLLDLRRKLSGHSETSFCFKKILDSNEDRWSFVLEKMAQRITRLNKLTEKSIFQLMKVLEKMVRTELGKTFHRIKSCMDFE